MLTLASWRPGFCSVSFSLLVSTGGFFLSAIASLSFCSFSTFSSSVSRYFVIRLIRASRPVSSLNSICSPAHSSRRLASSKVQTVVLSSICVSYSSSAIFCHVGVTKCYTPQGKSVLSTLIRAKLIQNINTFSLFFSHTGFSHPIIVSIELGPVSRVLPVTLTSNFIQNLVHLSLAYHCDNNVLTECGVLALLHLGM